MSVLFDEMEMSVVWDNSADVEVYAFTPSGTTASVTRDCNAEPAQQTLIDVLVKRLKGQQLISDGYIKEQMRSLGLCNVSLPHLIGNLVRDKVLAEMGKGNYAKGKSWNKDQRIMQRLSTASRQAATGAPLLANF